MIARRKALAIIATAAAAALVDQVTAAPRPAAWKVTIAKVQTAIEGIYKVTLADGSIVLVSPTSIREPGGPAAGDAWLDATTLSQGGKVWRRVRSTKRPAKRGK